MPDDPAQESKEIMGVFYNSEDPRLLYGNIAFYRSTPGSGEVPAHKQSAPFVIAEILSPERVVVLGSAEGLIQDIRRLIREVRRQIDELNETLRPFAKGEAVQGERVRILSVPDGEWEHTTYVEAKRKIADGLILIATQARNLFNMFGHLRGKISLRDYQGKKTGNIQLMYLFNYFVHNRYFFMDGEYVFDLFPDRPRREAPISQTFMGYSFNWIEFINLVEAATEEIKIKHFTGMLRSGLRKLSPSMPHDRVVLLVQNLYSFTLLFRNSNPGQVYGNALNQLLSDQISQRADEIIRNAKEGDSVTMTSLFHSPTISIHEDLSQKKFNIHVDFKSTFTDQDGHVLHKDRDFIPVKGEVEYEQLLSQIERAFGDRPLLGFRP